MSCAYAKGDLQWFRRCLARARPLVRMIYCPLLLASRMPSPPCRSERLRQPVALGSHSRFGELLSDLALWPGHYGRRRTGGNCQRNGILFYRRKQNHGRRDLGSRYRLALCSRNPLPFINIHAFSWERMSVVHFTRAGGSQPPAQAVLSTGLQLTG